MMRKIILFLLIVNINYQNYSQKLSDLIGFMPNPPDVYNLKKSIDSDIDNTNTGAISVSLPIYTISLSKELNLPIVLKYQSNGIKVTQEASNVGMGWNINFPIISQSVNDLDDTDQNYLGRQIIRKRPEYIYSSTPGALFTASCPSMLPPDNYSFNNQQIIPANSYVTTESYRVPINGSYVTMEGFFQDSHYDSEPDIFIAYIENKQIKFITDFDSFYANSGIYFKILNIKGFKITYSDQIITIISPSGNKYHFYKNHNEEVFQSSSEGPIVTPINKTHVNWHVTKIETPEKRNILFEYENNVDVKNSDVLFQNLYYTTYVSQGNTSYEGIWNITNGYTPVTTINGQNLYSGRVFSKQNHRNIKKISWKNNMILFNYSNRNDKIGAKKIESISLTSGNKNIYDVNFNYFYTSPNDLLPYYSGNIVNDLRLFLQSVTINGEKYSFKYNNRLLPRKSTFSVDYWGYYNGKSNQNLIANPNDLTANTNGLNVQNDRKADIDYTKAGILEKVIFPTKGYNIYHYGLNKIESSFVENANIQFGEGLRIDSISSYNENNILQKKEIYEYHDGRYRTPLKLLQKNNNYSHCLYPPNYPGIPPSTCKPYTYDKYTSTNSLHDYPYDDGVNLAYSFVTKKFINLQNNIESYSTKKYFYNIPNVNYSSPNADVPSLASIDNPNTPTLGQINKIEYYNSTNYKVREQNFVYENSVSTLDYGVRFGQKSIELNMPCIILSPADIYYPSYKSRQYITYYPIFSKFYRLKSENNTLFFGGKFIESEKSYVYDQFDNISSIQTKTNSNVVDYYEHYNYTSSIMRFNDKNILNREKEYSKYSYSGKLLVKEVYDYNDLSNYLPTALNVVNLSNNNLETDISYTKYDNEYGNLQEYKIKNSIPVAIIWGYSFTHPIAKIEGATYDQVQNLTSTILAASDADGIQGTQVSEDTLIIALDAFRQNSEVSNYQITTYTYDPLIGVKSITPPSGIREYYIYDTANRLEKILDINGKILKEFQYNYNSVHYNTALSQSFIKNNCPPGSIGNPYTYTVNENQYSSNINEDEANQMAQNDINQNGQNTANALGTCTSLNCNFSFNNSQLSGGGGLSFITTNQFRINASYSFNSILDWTNGVLLGTVHGDCLPSVSKTVTYFSNSLWSATLNTNGQIVVKFQPGPTSNFPPNGTTINLSLTYTLN